MAAGRAGASGGAALSWTQTPTFGGLPIALAGTSKLVLVHVGWAVSVEHLLCGAGERALIARQAGDGTSSHCSSSTPEGAWAQQAQ